MTAIVDYGVGNLFSLRSSLDLIGEKASVTSDPDVLMSADRVILPGVGAFGDAADKLAETGLGEVVKAAAGAGKPLLGICLGMQLLFDRSLEFGEHAGLGLIPGVVIPMEGNIPDGLKIPQIGWNSLSFTDAGKKSPLFSSTPDGAYVYFVHSFFASDCDASVTAYTDYGVRMTAAAARGNVCGTQFHPEKSGSTGLDILRAFCSMS